MGKTTIGYFLKTGKNKILNIQGHVIKNIEKTGIYTSELQARKFAYKHNAQVHKLEIVDWHAAATVERFLKAQHGYSVTMHGSGYRVVKEKVLFENVSFGELLAILDCVQYKKTKNKA